MKTVGTIYGLTDPRTGKVRYVGQTRLKVKTRYDSHLREVKKPKYNTRKINWTLSLLNKGLKPGLVVLEEVPIEFLDEREKFWIKNFEENDLVNLTDGGQDGICKEFYEKRAKHLLRHVFSYNEFTKEITEYQNKQEASKILNTTVHNISSAIHCKGRCCELFWAYNPEVFKTLVIIPDKKYRAVVVYNDTFRKEFKGVREAMKYFDIPISKHNPISARLAGKLDYFGPYKGTCGPYRGYYWKYKDKEANLKSDELQETPEVDNLQPSLGSKETYQEGSTTNE